MFIGSSAAVLGDYARVPLHGRAAGLAILALTARASPTSACWRPVTRSSAWRSRCAARSGGPGSVSLDPLRLRQILLNPVGNALKFAERGGVRVSVDYDAHEEQISVQVADTGPGISAAALARVFDAFQQADGTVARRHGGAGLGLTISRNLAALMGGGIEVRSTEGEGTCFTVHVAAPSAAAARRDSAAGDAENRGRARDAAGARVLLVDDSEDIRELVTLHVRRLGAEVSTAPDGEAGVAAALASLPDVVLMDVEMPRMDGVQATRALREAGYAGIVVALTAHGDAQQLARLAAAGSDAVMGKPVTRERLARVLVEQLARRRAAGGPAGEQ